MGINNIRNIVPTKPRLFGLNYPSIPPQDFLLHYNMDGNDTNVVEVNSPNIVSGPGGDDGKAYASMSDGAEYLTADADSSKFAIGTGAYTIAFRVKNPGGQSGTDTPIRTGNGNDATTIWFYISATGVLGIRSAGSNVTQAGTIRSGEWQSVIITSSGSGGTLNIYVDNSLDKTDTSQAYNLTDSSSVQMGFISDIQIDDIYFYDRVLSNTERIALYNYQHPIWTALNDLLTYAYLNPSIYDSITQSGNLVSLLEDQKGSYDFGQAIGAEQPQTWVAAQYIAGNNMLLYDGIDDHLEFVGDLIPTDGQLALYLVGLATGFANIRDPFFSAKDTAFELNANSATQFDGRIDEFGIGTGDVDYTGGPFNGPSIHSLVFDFSNNNMFGYVDGTLRGDGTGAYDVAINVTSTEIRLMCSRLVANCLGGSLGPVILTEDITDATRYKYEGWLAWIFGLQGSLPSAHPYKDMAPRI